MQEPAVLARRRVSEWAWWNGAVAAGRTGPDRMWRYLVFSGGQIVINLRFGSRRYNERTAWQDVERWWRAFGPGIGGRNERRKMVVMVGLLMRLALGLRVDLRGSDADRKRSA